MADSPKALAMALLGASDKGLKRRSAVLPFSRNEDGGVSATYPQGLIDALTAFTTPGAVAKGYQPTPNDAANMALQGLGVTAARGFGSAPSRGVVSMSGAQPKAGLGDRLAGYRAANPVADPTPLPPRARPGSRAKRFMLQGEGGHDVPVYRNPSSEMVSHLTSKAARGAPRADGVNPGQSSTLRAYRDPDTGDLYLWDPYAPLEHAPAAKQLGLRWDQRGTGFEANHPYERPAPKLSPADVEAAQVARWKRGGAI